MRFVIDMNMGAEWIGCLEVAGHQAVHWSSVGTHDAADDGIIDWARSHGHVVLTADLDFGMTLVRERRETPSVVQLRTDATIVRLVGGLVLDAIERTRAELAAGALVTVEPDQVRLRRLSDPDEL